MKSPVYRTRESRSRLRRALPGLWRGGILCGQGPAVTVRNRQPNTGNRTPPPGNRRGLSGQCPVTTEAEVSLAYEAPETYRFRGGRHVAAEKECRTFVLTPTGGSVHGRMVRLPTRPTGIQNVRRQRD